jgi:acetylornithine/succinyldiaminopimelate/putrescine aminotransferase
MSMSAEMPRAYERFVNPCWAELLRAMDFDAAPVSASGCRIEMSNGKNYLDFLCGYGGAPLGHAPHRLCERMAEEMRGVGANLFPLGCSDDAGLLAERLLALAASRLAKVHFASTGAEAVESAIKFAFIHTGRRRLLTIDGGFHGLTTPPTMLAGDKVWREGIRWDPRIALQAPFARTDLIADHIRSGKLAAVLLEPVQGSAGARCWSADTLLHLRHECDKHGCLIIFDEVLSGGGRCGDWFAAQTLGAADVPDISVISKGLSGGLIPVSAVLMREEIYRSVFGRPGKEKIHGSTFGAGKLAMRCALHTIELIEEEGLVANARRMGDVLSKKMAALGFRVQGHGLMLSLALDGELDQAYGDAGGAALWEQLLKQHVIAIPAAHDARSVRLIPPLNVSEADVDCFIDKLHCINMALHAAA